MLYFNGSPVSRFKKTSPNRAQFERKDPTGFCSPNPRNKLLIFKGKNKFYGFFPGEMGWGFFFWFLGANSLLSFFPLPPGTKILIILFGILVPLVLAGSKSDRSSPPIGNWNIAFPVFSRGLILTLALFAVFLRFFRLTSLAGWPTFDESMFCFFGLEFSKTWDFHLFQGISQIPPLSFWILGTVFKLFGPSLFTLWFVPALFSALTLPLVFLTTRKFLSPSLSGLMTWLWAFSFWPLYEGRFCVQYSLFMFWAWLVLFLFSRYVQAKTSFSQKTKLFLLALGGGAGFYISVSWAFPMAAVTFLLFQTRKQWSHFFWFLLLAGFLTLPFSFTLFRGQYGSYLYNLWVFKEALTPAQHLSNIGLYLSGLFWGIPSYFSISSYGPHWGGMLNPILGSFFLVGLARLFQLRDKGWAGVMLGIFLFFFIPALITKDLEFFRIFQLLPLLLLTLALGFQHLMKKLAPHRGQRALMALLLVSLCLDVFHLYGAFPRGAMSENAWPLKSNHRFKAHQILDQLHQKLGPGMVFDQFQGYVVNFPPRYFDPSLTLSAYSYNTAANPKFSWKDARWAAFLFDGPLLPILVENFPDARFYRLYDEPVWDQTLALGFIPDPAKHEKVLQQWLRVDKEWVKVAHAALNHVTDLPNEPILRAILDTVPSVRGDSFLETCLWLKFLTLIGRSDGDYVINESILARIPDRLFTLEFMGPPLGQAYVSAGFAYFKHRRFAEARAALIRAEKLDPSLKMPDGFRKNLENLENLQKKARGNSP